MTTLTTNPVMMKAIKHAMNGVNLIPMAKMSAKRDNRCETNGEDIDSHRYKCVEKDCDKSYIHINKLFTHLEKCHQISGSDIEDNIRKHFGYDGSDDNNNASEDKASLDEKLKHRLSHLWDAKTNKYVCGGKGCNRSYSDVTTISMHLKRVHSGKTFISGLDVYKCPQSGCKSQFDNRCKLTQHIKCVHRRKRSLFCSHHNCDRGFQTQSGLKKHELSHTAEKTERCHYPDCAYTSFSAERIKSHVQRVHESERTIVCEHEGCGRAFKTVPEVKQHALVHESAAYVCSWPGCDQRFRRQLQLTRHMSRHTNEPTVRCGLDGCGEMFLTAHLQRKHQQRAHNRPMCVKLAYGRRCDWPGCEWFGRAFPAHRRTHTGEMPFACEWPVCGKRFRCATFLRDHMNVHNNLRPYACHWPGCTYRSNNSANINKHTKQVHRKHTSGEDMRMRCSDNEITRPMTSRKTRHHMTLASRTDKITVAAMIMQW
ncbi:unnamed protein product [Medioppia subpectinata]|uniref:C2H2-type domain-containing protein n=1 Tax=Medioppia subpectinata TaxID=1979941 RepID=A0A7R9Q697_9ACAR|nr:unnamed protein product [Medioppia subpectinata]CAG2114632.1 unnamed protein product [Medioppia subpectinata]